MDPLPVPRPRSGGPGPAGTFGRTATSLDRATVDGEETHMAIRDLLQRFRPAGAPGAASGAAVPADRVAEATRELAPVFEELAGTSLEAAGLRERAVAQATRRRRATAEDADQIRMAARTA